MTTIPRVLTDTFVAGVEQLGERGGGSLLLDDLSTLLLSGQLTQHARRHALNVLNGRVEELKHTVSLVLGGDLKTFGLSIKIILFLVERTGG